MADIIINDWGSADALLAEIGRIDNETERFKTARAATLRKTRETYRGLLDDLATERRPLATAVAKWCRKRRRHDFGDAKSRHLDHGEVGWRLGNPAIKPLTRKQSEDAALVKVVADGPSHYVRITRSLNRERMLDDYKAGKLTDEQLAAWGLRVAQTERFYIDTTGPIRDRSADARPQNPEG